MDAASASGEQYWPPFPVNFPSRVQRAPLQMQGLQQHDRQLLCATVATLAASHEYIAMIAIKLFAGLAGAFVNALQLWRRGTGWTSHDNTKVALAYIYVWNCLFGLAVGSFYIYDLARLPAGCHLFDYRIVIAVRGFALSAVLTKSLLFMSIACERCYASAWPAHYEEYKKHPLATHIFCWILAILSTLVVYFVVSEHFLLFVPKLVPTFDLKTSENKEEYTGLIWSIAGVQFLAIVVCAIDAVWSYLLSRKRFENGVNGQFQLASNLRVLKLVLPVATLDSGLTLIGTVMNIVSLLSFKSQSEFARHLYLTQHTFAVYTLFFLPIAVEIREYFYRKESRKNTVTVAQAKTPEDLKAMETNLYFAALSKAWDEVAPRSTNGSRASRRATEPELELQPIPSISSTVSNHMSV